VINLTNIILRIIFGWRYYFGGHYLKQYEKNATNRRFRKVQKEKVDEGFQDYINDENIDE